MAIERNFKGVQFEAIRKVMDGKFNAVHDELTECYKAGTTFRTFGVLDKDKFDKLHGLIFHLRDIAFHEANQALPLAQRVPGSKHNEIRDINGNVVGTVVARAATLIQKLKAEGLELTI